MKPELMREALSADQKAREIKRKLEEFVLLKRDTYGADKEKIVLGNPVTYRQGECHRVEVPVPEEVRRWAFRLWRREQQLVYNALVRRINQIGMATDLDLIEVEPSHL